MSNEDLIRDGERRAARWIVQRLRRTARGLSPIVRDVLLTEANEIEAVYEYPKPPEAA